MHENIENVEEAITAVKRNGAALKGNIETREHSKHFRSRNVVFRLGLDLFANVIHIKVVFMRFSEWRNGGGRERERERGRS